MFASSGQIRGEVIVWFKWVMSKLDKGYQYLRLILVLAALSVLTGCAGYYKEGVSVPVGPPVTDNKTPLSESFSCMRDRMWQVKGAPPIRVTVGNVRDYTGKYNEQEGGHAITQGGSLMVISALGKLSGPVQLFERFDTQITDMELQYMDKRQLGDGKQYTVQEADHYKKVPWKPYYGGSIIGSDYFIVGGITELNYNIRSGGVEVEMNNVGPKHRTYTVNVAADLRIVDSHSLAVIHTTSLQKQIVGYENNFGVFKFFGNTLININAGYESQEPVQLGVRTTLELGVLELLASVSGVDYKPCVSAL